MFSTRRCLIAFLLSIPLCLFAVAWEWFVPEGYSPALGSQWLVGIDGRYWSISKFDGRFMATALAPSAVPAVQAHCSSLGTQDLIVSWGGSSPPARVHGGQWLGASLAYGTAWLIIRHENEDPKRSSTWMEWKNYTAARPPVPFLWIAVPFWMIAIVFGSLPTIYGWIMIMRNWRNHRRRRAGSCHVCGYDLRGSADRCPECGEAISRDPSPAASPNLRTAHTSLPSTHN